MKITYKNPEYYYQQTLNLTIIDCVGKKVNSLSDIKEILKYQSYVISGAYGKYLISAFSDCEAIEIYADFLNIPEDEIHNEESESYYHFWAYDCVQIEKFTDYKKTIRSK